MPVSVGLIPQLIETCRNIGFVSADVGLDADNCKVLVNIEQQSPDIAQGVHGHLTKRPEEIGAGDLGYMFGYATDETPELMPLSHVLATKLGSRLTDVRKNGTCAWLRPDGKTQVTVEYLNENGAMVPTHAHTVLISTEHDETVSNDEIAADLEEHVIKPVIPEKYLDEKTIFHLNPSGRFVIGGPHGEVESSFRLWGSTEGDVIHPADCMHELLDQVRHHKVNTDGNVTTVMVTTLVLEGWQRKLDPEYDVMHTLQTMLFKVDWAESLFYTVEGLMAP